MNVLPELLAYMRDADKSLAQPTSRCCRTELLVSERRVCSCIEFQALSCYRGRKEACQVTCAISTTWRRLLSSSFIFLQGKAPKEIHAILIETGEYAPSYVTIKNWVAEFKHGDFSTCDAPRPGQLKAVTTLEIIDQIHELILEDHRILKFTFKQLHLVSVLQLPPNSATYMRQ